MRAVLAGRRCPFLLSVAPPRPHSHVFKCGGRWERRERSGPSARQCRAVLAGSGITFDLEGWR